MDNQKVNIYIETSVHSPAQHGGYCMYVMEYLLQDGTPKTVMGGSGWRDKKETELVLQALAAALARIGPPCVIDVYTTCPLIRGAVETGWLEQWQRQGWKNAKGEEIRYRKLWERIAALMEPHLVFVSPQPHYYREWMRNEMGKQNDSRKK